MPIPTHLHARTASWLLAIGLALTVATSCADDGRALAEPQEWQTTTTRPLPPTSAPPQEVGTSGLTLTSPDFGPGDDAPRGVRCDGGNVFPNLEWSGLDPALGVVEFAVTLADQTDPEEPLLLWLMAGIDPGLTSLESGRFPNEGAFETLNDYGQPGWGNPCLETFENGRRDLQFRLYALGQGSDLASGDPGNEAWDTVAAKAVETATLLMRIDAAP